MKRIVLCAAAALTVAGLFAQTASQKNMTPEERAARKAAARQRHLERTGGYITYKPKGNRVIAFVNVNDAADEAVLNEVAEAVMEAFMFPVVVSPTKPANAGVVVEFKSSDYPATIMTLPENAYAMLNVSRLKTDNPDAAKLKTRLVREAWRTLVYALGGGNDEQPKCLMKPIASLAELDALGSTCPCPMSSGAISTGAARMGVKAECRVTYRQACEEGWAPAPTNGIQKAVWDKVHEMPTNPIKILPETKKVNE